MSVTHNSVPDGSDTRPTAHFFQHVPFEGLGCIGPWLEQRGYRLCGTHLYRGEPLPALEDVELLIVMGGPMGVDDTTQHPWLEAEKVFIRDAIEAGCRVLGVCLGAQLIASALGAAVFPNPVKEIGWFPVVGEGANESAVFSLPAETMVFHWHGDTFDLPPGARRLAHSAHCLNQAFVWGQRVIGLQFHLETTPAAAAAMVQHGSEELQPSATVQRAEHILAASPQQYLDNNHLMAQLLDDLLSPAGVAAQIDV